MAIGIRHAWWQQQKRALFFVAGLFLLLFLVGACLVYEIYLSHPAFRGTKEITIAQGLGSRKIGALLKQEGVIGSKWAFVAYVWLRGEASSLKQGRYTVVDTMTISEVARDLVAGMSREQIITIPEGWDTRDIAAYLDVEGFAAEVETLRFFASSSGATAGRFSYLSELPQGVGLEGYLFPDTYRIFSGATLEDITARMLENFDRKLTPDLREAIARQKKSIFEIVTMASLIEKEVRRDEDRAIISGILWKRFAAGMPLQVDATITYAQAQNAKRKIQNNGRIFLEDTKIDSPYNTYRYPGLPRGPIANPGLSAILAAIYSKASPYLYYLSTPDGHTIFSRTLEEHNIAKAKYLNK